MKALILAPFLPEALERVKNRIEPIYESWTETKKLLSPEELSERLQQENIPIVIIEADFIFAEVFEGAPNLRLVGICRNAVDHVDVGAATRHGVLVVNTPGRNAVSVAELTIGMMLSLARQIPAADSLIRSGGWDDPVGPYMARRGLELSGKVAGIIGFGAIGAEVARRLHAFDMQVITYDPYVSPEKLAQADVQQVKLPVLMERSDFALIHCAVTPETTGLIGGDEFALMKPTAYLVNTAGWEIIEEKALMDALQQKRIAGAAFDVFETHPVSPDSPLLKLDNVLLTPHIGGATDGTLARYSRMLAEDIERFLDGKRPRNLVNPEAWPEHG